MKVVISIFFSFLLVSISGQDISNINFSIKTYKGFIDNKYPITAQITIRKEEWSSRKYYHKVYGSYYYDKYKIPMDFLGTAKKDSIKFKVYSNVKELEQFIGKVTYDSIIGHWIKNGKSLPFYLVPIVDYRQKNIICEIPISFFDSLYPRLDHQCGNNFFIANTDDKIIINRGRPKQLNIFDVHSLKFEKIIDIDCSVNKMYAWGEGVVIVSFKDITYINIENGAVIWKEKIPLTWYDDIYLEKGKIFFYNITDEGKRETICFDLLSKSFDVPSKDFKYILTDNGLSFLYRNGRQLKEININGGEEVYRYPNIDYNTIIQSVDSINVLNYWTKYYSRITIVDNDLNILWEFETSRSYQTNIIIGKYLLLWGPKTKLYDIKSHKLLWVIEQPLTSDFLIEDDIIYFISNEVATAIDFYSGNILWAIEIYGGRKVVKASDMIFFINSWTQKPLSMITGIRKIKITSDNKR